MRSFHRADMTEADFPAASFAAIVSFFALIHVPIAEQPRLIQRISGWLRPRGLLLATLGHDAWTGTEEDWHGATMYWSQADADTYNRWLEGAGLVVLSTASGWDQVRPNDGSTHGHLMGPPGAPSESRSYRVLPPSV